MTSGAPWEQQVLRALRDAGIEVTCGTRSDMTAQRTAGPLAGFVIVSGDDAALREHARAQQQALPESERDRGREHPPVVVVREVGAPFDEALFASLAHADVVCSADPIEVLLSRARVLQLRASARRRAHERDEAVRERGRRVSQAVLAASDVREVARIVVAGIGEVCGTDRAVLSIIGDERMPPMRHTSPPGDADDLAAVARATETAVHDLARALWKTSSVLEVAPGHAWQDATLAAGHAASQRLGTSAEVFVPIGQGDAALGVLWVGASEPRAWSPTELGVLRAIANATGVSLLQAQAVAVQARAARASERLRLMQRDLTASISHELRTPLTSVMGYLELLRAEPELPVRAKQMVVVAERNARVLSGLVEQAVRLSRFGAYDDDAGLGTVDLGDLIAAVVADHEVSARAKGVTVAVRTNGTGAIFGHAARLEQAFSTVVHNAVKYTPAGGSVHLEVDHVDGACSVAIRDTGIGIPQAELSSIFDRFYRGSNVASSTSGGLGLGLSLFKQVLDGHDATVHVRSSLGLGTAVDVRFPASDAESPRSGR